MLIVICLGWWDSVLFRVVLRKFLLRGRRGSVGVLRRRLGVLAVRVGGGDLG